MKLFEPPELLGLISVKRLLTPFSIVKYMGTEGFNFSCVYIFGIRVAYFTL